MFNQKALSAALRAAAARRRHSSARRRNCSTLTLRAFRRPLPSPANSNSILVTRLLNFSRGFDLATSTFDSAQRASDHRAHTTSELVQAWQAGRLNPYG